MKLKVFQVDTLKKYLSHPNPFFGYNFYDTLVLSIISYHPLRELFGTERPQRATNRRGSGDVEAQYESREGHH